MCYNLHDPRSPAPINPLKLMFGTSGSFVTNIAIIYAWEMAIRVPSDPLVHLGVINSIAI